MQSSDTDIQRYVNLSFLSMEVTYFARKKSNDADKSFLWTDDKLKSLWVSLLSLENVSKTCKDTELQGILLLLETAFNLFRSLKEKHESVAAAYSIVENELKLTKDNLCKVNEELKLCKSSSCDQCLELEKEVAFYKKKLETNENRIKSIVSILSTSNTEYSVDSETDNTAVAKAYDLVSQMLLGDEVRHGTKRIHQHSGENRTMRTLHKKKTKLNEAPISCVLPLREVKGETEHTLVPETLHFEDRPITGNLKEVSTGPFLIENTFVPETLPIEEKAILETLDGIGEIPPLHEEDSHTLVSCKIETTPKKITALETTIRSSPILGGSNKKPSYKNVLNYSSSLEDSSDVYTLTSQILQPCLEKRDESRSPSLLNVQHSVSNSAGSEADRIQSSEARKCVNHKVSIADQENEGNSRRAHADFWKLKPSSNTSIDSKSGNKSRSQRLKQTTLSLACFPKKQDLCTLKEFNGGLRQSKNETNFVDSINGNCDEETSLKLAIQESLNVNENFSSLLRKDERVDIKHIKATEDEDGDDFVSSSPSARRRKLTRPKRAKNVIIGKGDASTSNSNPKKTQTMDETLFIPLYSSTMNDGNAGERDSSFVKETTDKSSAEELLKEMGGIVEAEHPTRHETSFDRIPEKRSSSPNYKYRRDAVRKKEDRQKLQGWECEQCKNYHALAGEDLDSAEIKQRLNMCSKHRDKYCLQSNTPQGYWDIKFPDSEFSRLGNKRK